MESEEILLNKARELGAVGVGIIPAGRPAGLERFYRWLDSGCNAEMNYLSARREAYADPNRILPGVKSLFVLAFAQPVIPVEASTDDSACLGRIASYAAGEDYHNRIRVILKELAQTHRSLFPQEKCRGVVDTAPILEKDAAVAAGLGYIGRNTLLQCKTHGSRVNLAVLLSTATLQMRNITDSQFLSCKNCKKCIESCPTGALSEAGLDARRCLSYWLIEHRGEIPDEIAAVAGNRLFGCDTCQDVCPHNAPGNVQYINIESVLAMTEEEFQVRFSATPVSRCGLEGLKRNALIVKRNAERS